MSNFLQHLAQYYFNKYQTNISEFCFVFPGRRSGLFFQQHLSKLTDKPLWSPTTLTINEFIQEFAKDQIADKITLVFELYQVYESIYKSGTSFDEFMPWGEIILNDFDDIDKYLADPKQVFSNLLAIKEIEDDYSFLTEEQIETIQSFWHSFNPNKLSEHQEEFIRIWEKLYEVYTTFNKQLKDKNITYEGAVYRSIADKITQKTPLNIKYPKIVFVAFNALNQCEKKLFNHLQITNKADFIWDVPEWLLSSNNRNPNPFERTKAHEAIRFIEENIINFPSPSDWNLPGNKNLPDIKITSVASDTAQTQIVNDFLTQQKEKSLQYDKNEELDSALRNAVILTDETILLPVLHAIPQNDQKINITMGYPIKNTPAYGLLELIFDLQKNCRQTKAGKTWFYFRNVLPILTHQYVEPLNNELHAELAKNITRQNKTYIEANELQKSKLLISIFHPIKDSNEFSEYLTNLLYLIHTELQDSENSQIIEKEFIYQLFLTVTQLSDLISKLNVSIQINTWIKLFKRAADLKSIPFSGEPLKGLQLMGILETRALDFENLIILNMNEGTFPQSGATNSLVPFSLRKAFNLPTIEHQDSIFAYYFYRLIHRAKNVHLLYNSSAQGMQTGEMSRFLFQLKYEYPKDKLSFSTAVDHINIQTHQAYYIEKDEKTMNILNQYLNKGSRKLSPSALSSYFECPMRFYYKYILKASEPDEITEEIDPRIFGTLFHETVEELYKPYLGKEVSPEDIKAIAKDQKRIKNALLESFNKYFSTQLNQSDFIDIQGKNVLIYDIIIKYIQQFLVVEQRHAPFILKGLEKQVESTIQISEGKTLNVGGTIDRLDEKDGIVRVIDYKTGSGEDFFNEIEELFLESKHKNKKAIFQTLLYSYIIKKDFPENISFHPGVVWIKKIFTSPDYSLKKGARSSKEKLSLKLIEDEYITEFKSQMNILFDPQIPFKQTEYSDNCKICSYKGICGKQ
ncbi:PD-(D/E)XK nuclease family protein [Plebeiibacterium sediminum]|uniref:PD-(D/E)XK nuclease family protein n=1 Tax=Plebeiibacterium sediminum TaxID=2992112 RepID=A0AAE3M263_9BACT|nr:PD-(D/E)XK nuclease family protein [Plebeiobacterium sediminum]MCW3785365.1 PD-(D/E)XK nuclease family protein [Plebeiobacterium sediminum]